MSFFVSHFQLSMNIWLVTATEETLFLCRSLHLRVCVWHITCPSRLENKHNLKKYSSFSDLSEMAGKKAKCYSTERCWQFIYSLLQTNQIRYLLDKQHSVYIPFLCTADSWQFYQTDQQPEAVFTHASAGALINSLKHTMEKIYYFLYLLQTW